MARRSKSANVRLQDLLQVMSADDIAPMEKVEQLAAEEQARIQNQWSLVRARRDQLMRDNDWRYVRYQRQTRAGTAPTDDLTKLDQYMQSLADITAQQDPYNIVWPNLE